MKKNEADIEHRLILCSLKPRHAKSFLMKLFWNYVFFEEEFVSNLKLLIFVLSNIFVLFTLIVFCVLALNFLWERERVMKLGE